MTSQFLPQGAEYLSKILVIGRVPNPTFDLYIAPRLSDYAQSKLVRLDPYFERLGAAQIDPLGLLIIINRYVTPEVIAWLERNRSAIKKIVWLVDDDLSAMVFGRGVRLMNRVRPAVTLFFKKRLRKLVDQVIVSTANLATRFSGWPVTVSPPTAQPILDNRPIDPKQLYYFNVMHGPEHAFLWSIMKKVFAREVDMKLTLTANGYWQHKWASLEQVTVLPEIPYQDYGAYLQNLETGGLFLVPLTVTSVNYSRSDAKLIDVMRAGSAALVADHPAYKAFNCHNGRTTGLQQNVDKWVDAIERHVNKPTLALQSKQAVLNFVSNRYQNREMML